MKQKLKRFSIDSVLCLSGTRIFSVSVNMFSVPNEFVLGGLTGVATVLNYLFNFIPIGTAIFIMNIPLFILSHFKLGKTFLYKTVIATIIFTAGIDIGAIFLSPYEGDTLLASIFCGITSGLGLGLIFATGATTGGTDIIATLLHKKFPHLSMGRTLLAVDFIVVFISWIAYGKIESVMYALIVIFISSKVVDTVLYGTASAKTVMSVTAKKEEISAEIMNQLQRGVSILPVVGGYTKASKDLIVCTVKNNQISLVNRIIKQIDPHAFTMVFDTGEVIGEGFD